LIGFLDTSALVPLLIREASSVACQRFWNDADAVVAVRLAFVEIAAALAQAQRLGRLTEPDHRSTIDSLEQLWQEIDVVEVDDRLMRRSADFARRFGLRGYDAVHCAAAEQLSDESLVAATGDRQLLGAWSGMSVATYDTNAPGGAIGGIR
jgi:predicted nucleic acid-binding protein